MSESWSGPYCGDCPDREGCGQGVPCDTARSAAGLPLVHSPAAHDVIAAELVACTLGQRHRPELVDRAWKRDQLQETVRRFAETMRRAVAAGTR